MDKSTLLKLSYPEEHHIASFDPTSFFILHDYDSSGTWTPEEIRKTYGLNDESNAGVSEENKQDAVRAVFELFEAVILPLCRVFEHYCQQCYFAGSNLW